MKTQTTVFEGTWEEIQKHADKLARHRVRVTVLLSKKNHAVHKGRVKPKDQATAEFLEEFFGAWEGNDIEKCLRGVYATRSKARF
jgi:hypothetical protein